MQCPYRDFNDCLVEKCPSCVYETEVTDDIGGMIPWHMSVDKAIQIGYAWKTTKTTYKFVSCKLVEGGVQPVPSKKEIVHNNNSTRVTVVKQSLL